MLQLLKRSQTTCPYNYLVMLQTRNTAAELRQKVLIIDRKDYCPAVSHICILILVCSSMRTSREQNQTPRVAVQPYLNQSLVNRFKRQLLPTPGGPIIIILNVFSYSAFIYIRNISIIPTVQSTLNRTLKPQYQVFVTSTEIIAICWGLIQKFIIQMNRSSEQTDSNLPNLAEVISNIPFWTRTLYFGLIGCWLLDLITGVPSSLIACSLYNTIQHVRIWTFLTSCFYIDSLFLLSVVIFNFNSFLPKLEFKNSSLVLAASFLASNVVIQVMTLLVQWLILQSSGTLNGVLGVWFSMVCEYCYYNQTGDIKFCCFAWKIKKTVYPFVLMGVLSLLRFSLPIDLIVGLLFATVQVKLCVLLPSKRKIYQKLSSFTSCITLKSWVPFQNSSQGGSSDQLNYQNLQSFESKVVQQDKSQVNNVFSKKGYRLGDY